MDERLLRILDRAFDAHAGADGAIDVTDLQKALGLRSEYLARRVFAAFDRDGDGVVRRDEFLEGVRQLVLGDDREKLLFAFKVHDHDGDGALSREELMRMIAISLGESEIIERATQPAEQLTRALFALADRDRDGRITFDELETVARRRPELLRRMTRSEAIWIAPNEDLLAWLDARGAGGGGRWARARENGVLPWALLALWALANVGIFAQSMVRFSALGGADPLMQAGRALGACIDFDGALVLIPMMRRLLSRVRATWLGRALPLDEAILFHKIVGHTLFALAVAHVAAFVLAYAAGHTTPLTHLLFVTERGLTGVVLFAVFAVMWVFSLSFIRRSSRFELFYFTHLLYVAWMALAIAHAPQFLFWAAVPLFGFAVEQALRLRRRGAKSVVVSSRALRSAVTRLEIARPAGFAFGPGDYAFVRLPAIARHEWHPFTISSAPERDAITFHIRSLGNWTSALRRKVEREPDAPDLDVYIDGPYGSPSAHIFASTHAVLIGAGIGVTPFASVLESLVLRANGTSDRPSKLQKAHFFWLNRDQYSFEWFAELLADLERIDQKGLLEVHLCMTGARGGATSLGLELAREAMHAAGRSDIITGLRTRTHLGPPDWEQMLGNIARAHQGHKVDAYFCGPVGLAKKLRPICERLGMTFREEKF